MFVSDWMIFDCLCSSASNYPYEPTRWDRMIKVVDSHFSNLINKDSYQGSAQLFASLPLYMVDKETAISLAIDYLFVLILACLLDYISAVNPRYENAFTVYGYTPILFLSFFRRCYPPGGRVNKTYLPGC